MALTTTYSTFKDKTSRWFPRYRSQRMDRVLARYESCELHPGNMNEILLRRAVEAWIVNDPKEFNNRDKKSKGLCTTLANDVGAKAQWDGSNREIISAHLLTPSSHGAGAARAVADSQWLKCSIEDHMQQLYDDGHADSTCVIVIDMQAKDGYAVSGADIEYNSNSVVDNQVSVLEAAAQYGMHVFEVRIEKWINRKDEADGPETRYFHKDPTLPEIIAAMRLSAADKFVSMTKPYYNSFQETELEDELRNRGIRLAIVMGFDANLCVRNTIFGTPAAIEMIPPTADNRSGRVDRPYLRGLLDRDISVLTSRVVLASSNGGHLVADYRMTG